MPTIFELLLMIAAVGVFIGVLKAAPLAFVFGVAGVGWVKFFRAPPQLPWRAFWTKKPLVLTALFAAAGIATQQLFMSLNALFAGAGGLLGASVATVVDLAIAIIVLKILEKKIMPDIFNIASDPAALEAFAAAGDGEPQPAPAEYLDLSSIPQDAAIAAIKEKVIGQDAIVSNVVSTIYRRAELRRKSKPVAVLMFVGATGAGKTELAKALADVLAAGRLVRFDCNQMTEASSTQRLIGAAPGYIGSEQGGQLTQAIGRLGSGVILFDEIEKAHSDVFKVLMTLFDEGRITEQSSGQAFSAAGFVIVCTSNAEHERIAEIARSVQDAQERLAKTKDALQTVFAPEQLARIDEIEVFAPLDRRAVIQIVGKFLLAYGEEVGVRIERVDTQLLIDLVLKREKLASYGIREVVRLVDKAVLDGLLEARRAGVKAVNIVVQADGVQVVPAAAAAAQAK